MEFKSLAFGIFGMIGLIFWGIGFFHLFKKPQLYIAKGQIQKESKPLVWFLFACGLVAWGFLTFSLMGPRKPLGYEKSDIEVNDIVFVVDVSRSMLADDFRPNRLEVAKKKISDFIGLKPTDRIGVIIFSEKAFTLLPLSTDLNLIHQIIGEIKVGFLGSGTNIGDALGLAVGRLSQSLAKNKVVILLTDGVSNVGVMTPLQAAEQASQLGVKIYTIGVGGAANARIPLPGSRATQMIPGGSIDMETLAKIAKITKGEAFQAYDEKALGSIMKKIEGLEKTKIEASGRILYDELYFKYLFLGVLLLLFTEVMRKTLRREGV